MSIFRSDNLNADISNHLAHEDERLSKLPVCSLCEEPIQQEMAVNIHGTWYCDDCLQNHRESTEL